jgi:hypothetical protein
MSDPLRYLEQQAGNAVREALEGLRAEIDRLRAVVVTSRRDGWIAGRAAALEHLRIRSNNIRTDNSIKGVLSERALRNVDLVDAIAHSIAALTPPENAVSDISAERRAELRQRIARAMPHALTDAELRAPLDATEPVTAGELAGVRGRLQRLAASDVSQTHAAFSDLNGPEFYGITARTAAALIERLARELDNAAATLLAVPGVVALLSEWIEGWNGFSDQEIHRRTDQPTYNRIMASRIALRRLTDKQEKPNG